MKNIHKKNAIIFLEKSEMFYLLYVRLNKITLSELFPLV